MSEAVSLSSKGSGASDGYEAFASLNDGFLGTGYSSSVEISFIAMVLIFGYVAITSFRYFLPETKALNAVTEALGLRDR
ncbi:MAG: hypothetical protein ACTSVG_13465 [Alphaproteobacteria bacterium]